MVDRPGHRGHHHRERPGALSPRLCAWTLPQTAQPQWYEGMLASGYEGTREIQKRLNNTLGWSATSGRVDNWVYEDANDVCT